MRSAAESVHEEIFTRRYILKPDFVYSNLPSMVLFAIMQQLEFEYLWGGGRKPLLEELGSFCTLSHISLGTYLAALIINFTP